MKYRPQPLKGVFLIEPERFGDSRGYFMETFRLEEFRRETGLPAIEFVQDNESLSMRGVFRGLHFQRGGAAQAKLVRVSRGEVLDIAVDLRPDSETFGRHVAVRLSAADGAMLFIPRGFAHGFLVLSDEAQFQYKVDNLYAPAAEATLRFDDPALGIELPVPAENLILSEKDLRGLPLDEIRILLSRN